MKLQQLAHKYVIEVLAYIHKNKNCRNVDIANNFKLQPVPLTRALHDLRTLGLITRDKEQFGVEVYYNTTPPAHKVLELSDKLNDILCNSDPTKSHL